MVRHSIQIPQLAPGDAFPPVTAALGPGSAAPGLLAFGGNLSAGTLQSAYRQGIFPWFSGDQPILWWSPDPRMALAPADFKLHRSLRRVLTKFSEDPGCEIRIDSAFAKVIAACATSARGTLRGAPHDHDAPGQGLANTWIVPAMVDAYTVMHRAGLAHSVETWVRGELVGGLYCVAIGKAVFGESMFSHATDSSKIALSALVCFCRRQGIRLIDCQQNTGHLASLGAREMARADFIAHLARSTREAAPRWQFDTLYWQELLKPPPLPTAS
ncbi:MAG: leucyl/phenylalanyl-tRNA--protein transferase [Rhodoferax sp.]